MYERDAHIHPEAFMQWRNAYAIFVAPEESYTALDIAQTDVRPFAVHIGHIEVEGAIERVCRSLVHPHAVIFDGYFKRMVFRSDANA